jgi:hypothetical protein
MQQFLQFIIMTFIYRPICFGRLHAHHQKFNNCSSSLWFYLRSVVLAVLLVVVRPLNGPTTTNSTAITTAVVELLMMGVRTPETC